MCSVVGVRILNFQLSILAGHFPKQSPRPTGKKKKLLHGHESDGAAHIREQQKNKTRQNIRRAVADWLAATKITKSVF